MFRESIYSILKEKGFGVLRVESSECNSFHFIQRFNGQIWVTWSAITYDTKSQAQETIDALAKKYPLTYFSDSWLNQELQNKPGSKLYQKEKKSWWSEFSKRFIK